MSEPELYRWGFDRSAWDARPEATTFSVGVYQWLPKASGKGLKKSGTIRVNGYVADAEAVYAKAAEVCRQLNEAGARFGALPEWVRKQYSVPRPNGVRAPAQAGEVSAKEANSIRAAVARERLLPAGFVRSHASTYVRRTGDVMQLVNFQTATWGGRFTVNLGLHYVFTPPVRGMARMPWVELDDLDCSMRARLGSFLPERRDTWFSYRTTPADFRERVEYAVDRSNEVLDQYAAHFADLNVVAANPPRSPRPFLISYPTVLHASVEMRLGRLSAAEARLKTALREEHPENESRFRRLLDLIPLLRAAKGNAAETNRLLSWLTNKS